VTDTEFTPLEVIDNLITQAILGKVGLPEAIPEVIRQLDRVRDEEKNKCVCSLIFKKNAEKAALDVV
jgi:hypothetical protein